MGLGLYGRGMHDFVMREAELGFRVAAQIDHDDAWGPEGAVFWAFNPGPTEEEEKTE